MYITPSTKPHAMLQPMAAISIVRTSSRPAVAALNVPVNVITMKRPNRISDTRSIGSRMRPSPDVSTLKAGAVALGTGSCNGPAIASGRLRCEVHRHVDHAALGVPAQRHATALEHLQHRGVS